MFSVDELEFLKLLLYGGGCLGCASFVTVILWGWRSLVGTRWGFGRVCSGLRVFYGTFIYFKKL